MFPNKILQKVSKAEVLQNARVGTAVHCLPEWQAPVWVLTGFACYAAILQENPGRTTPDFASVATLAVLAILRFPC